MPLDPGPIQHSQPFSLTTTIQTHPQTAIIVQLSHLAELLLQILNKLDGVLVLGVSVLEYLVLVGAVIGLEILQI